MKNKKFTVLACALFAGAAILLSLSGIGTARAAISAQSEVMDTTMQMQEVGVVINENGAAASELVFPNVPSDKTFACNKGYAEVINATNTGTIDEYIRIIVDMYWLNEKGEKVTELSPSYVKPALADGNYGDKWAADLAAAGWIVDPSSSYLNGTGEQLILYYSQAVAPGASTPAICNFLAVDSAIAKDVKQVETPAGITNVYKYDGVYFAMSAKADAIQTHNGSDAALSAWGVSAAAADGGFSLN